MPPSPSPLRRGVPDLATSATTPSPSATTRRASRSSATTTSSPTTTCSAPSTPTASRPDRSVRRGHRVPRAVRALRVPGRVAHALELIAGVIVLPQRQTALVAKQAAEVAVLSGGRLRLGVGTGWNWVEYEALGVPFRGRAERLEEQVELLRRLWAEPVVTTHTGFHDIERAGILPRPAGRSPSGSAAARSASSAGRHGSVTASSAHGPTRRPAGWSRQLRTFLAEAGREADQFDLSGMIDWAHGPEECAQATTAWHEARRHPPRAPGVRRAVRRAWGSRSSATRPWTASSRPSGPTASWSASGPPPRRRRLGVLSRQGGPAAAIRYQIGGWNGRPPSPMPAARCWMIAR